LVFWPVSKPSNLVFVSRSFGKRSPRSPAVRVRPPQSSFTSSPAQSLSEPSNAYLRVPSLFAASPSASTRARDSHCLATFRPQAFAASRRFTPQLSLRACFIPQPHSGFVTFRDFSLRAAFLPSSGRATPMPFSRSMLTGRNRLPHESTSTSRPFSTRSSVPMGRGQPVPPLAPLVAFPSPPGLRVPAWAPVTRRHPLMTFPLVIFGCPMVTCERLQRVASSTLDSGISVRIDLLETFEPTRAA
jgi:hypothetical protein